VQKQQDFRHRSLSGSGGGPRLKAAWVPTACTVKRSSDGNDAKASSGRNLRLRHVARFHCPINSATSRLASWSPNKASDRLPCRNEIFDSRAVSASNSRVFSADGEDWLPPP